MVACSKPNSAPPAPTQSYVVKGIVKNLPIEGNRNSELLIRHEAIPNFMDEQGKVVGMMSMTMPFKVESKSLLTDLAIGDEVEFELQVRWGDDPLDQITSIKKLAPGSVKF